MHCVENYSFSLGSCYVTSVVSDSVQPHRWQPTRLPYPWDSPGKNTGVGCHFLLQVIIYKMLTLNILVELTFFHTGLAFLVYFSQF